MSFFKFKYRSFLTSIITVSLACILISCTGFEPENINDLDLGIDDAEPVLVADAIIEAGHAASIRLSYTKGFSADTIVPYVYVEDAVVNLTSSDGEAEVLNYSESGLYLGSSIIGEINKSYTMTFQIDSLDYLATATMYPEVVIDSAFIRTLVKEDKYGNLSYHYQPYWEMVDNPATRDFYMFRFDIKGGKVASEILVVDDDRYVNSGGTLQISNENIWMGENVLVTAYVSKIDKQAYNYLIQLEKLLGGTSTGHVTPYNPLSHFGHGSMGYFRALSSTVVHISKVAVTDVIAMPDSGFNTLYWDYSPTAVSYTIYWDTNQGVTEQSNAVHVDSAITEFVHTGLTNGITYYYRAKVTDSWGNTSDLSSEVHATPAVLIPPVVTTRSGDGEVILTWNKIRVADQYMIYWDTTGNVTENSDSILIDTNITTYTHSNLVNGAYYQYRMLSIGAAGDRSVLSLPVWGSPDSISITDSVPTNVTATAGVNGVMLAWDTISGASGYAVYWDTIPWVNQWQSNRISDVTTPYSHTGLIPGKIHYFRIASVFGWEEHLSVEVSAVPDSIVITNQSPTNITTTAGVNEIALAWDSVSSASGYVIYWDTLPWVSNWSNRIYSVTAPYSHVGLKPATAHYYRIAAVVGQVEYLSEEVSAIPDTIPITALSPTNVIAYADTNSITLTWDPVSSATGYVVYWDTLSWITKWSNSVASAVPYYIHTGLEQGAVIYYRVAAVVGQDEHFSERVVGWIGR